MRPFLTYLVPTYWTAVFAIMAAQCASHPAVVGMPIAGSASESWIELDAAAGFGLSTAMAILLGLVATLFLWTVLTAILGSDDEQPGGYEEVASVAFGGALLVLIAELAVVSLAGGQSLLGSSPVQLGAVAASYAAVLFERRVFSRMSDPQADDVRSAARRMALGAAHSSVLTRLMAGGRQGAE